MAEGLRRMNRYQRQMQLPQVGNAGQARLAAAHVAVIGAGGLGCPVLQYLAGAGVGQITLFDPDTIEESNLHRQPIYRMADIGRPKAEVAKEVVLALNPDVSISAETIPLSVDLAPGIAKAADVVIDAADSFAVSYILSDTCLTEKTPLISASVLGQTGYVGGYCGSAPSLRAVFPDLPASSARCATAGVFGPVVGMFGTLQAQIALRVLLGLQPSGLGRIITADLAELCFSGFGFRGSAEPEKHLSFISPSTLNDSDLVIELRSENEAPRPIVSSAIRLSGSELDSLSPARDQRIVLCCHSGLRAWKAAVSLQERQLENIALLAASTCI